MRLQVYFQRQLYATVSLAHEGATLVLRHVTPVDAVSAPDMEMIYAFELRIGGF